MLNTWLQKPSVREFLLLDLITHKVPEEDKEWWARCKLNHTAAFLYLSYDCVRTIAGLYIYSLALPLFVLIIMCLFGAAIIICQLVIDRNIKLLRRTSQANYAAIRD